MKLEARIKNIKLRLIQKAQKNGIYENFGQTEVNQLKDDFHYFDLVYGTADERKQANLIDDFDQWCQNFDLTIINIYV